jgi:hypothetical protein
MGSRTYSEYILYILALFITHFLSHDTTLIFQMMTLDGIFSAVHFFKNFSDRNISESMIVEKNNSLYKHSFLDRYIYYTLSYLTYVTTCNFFWIPLIRIIYYGFLVSGIPSLLNRLLKTILFNKVRQKKEGIIKMIIAKQLAWLVKNASQTYLKKDIELDPKEFMVLFDDYSRIIGFSFDIAKNIFLVFVSIYIKKNANRFSYKIGKALLQYKTGDKLESFNTRTAKVRLTNIINNRQWGQLLEPNTYKAMIHLYQMNDDEVDILGIYLKIIYFNMAKMSAIWAIASATGSYLGAPLISIAMLFYRYNVNSSCNYNSYAKKVGVILSSLFVINLNIHFNLMALIMSFICQFGYPLIFNKINKSCIKFLINDSINKFHTLNRINSDLIPSLSFNIIFAMVFGFLINIQTIILLSIDIIRKFLVRDMDKKILVYCLLMSSCSLSNFNPVHVLHNACVLYILMAVINYQRFHKIMIVSEKNVSIFYTNCKKLKRDFINDCRKTTTNVGLKIKKMVKIKTLLFSNNKEPPNYLARRLEMQNTNLYPSVSMFDKLNSEDFLSRVVDSDGINKKLNDQRVIKRIKPDSDREIINNDLFELEKNDFIKAISVGTLTDSFVNLNNDSIFIYNSTDFRSDVKTKSFKRPSKITSHKISDEMIGMEEDYITRYKSMDSYAFIKNQSGISQITQVDVIDIEKDTIENYLS